ncbi:hypothetical protein BDN70DRAFT_690029 [Pholiota conissans]|uniref:Uncharacterized protein n=1 Tax=Pholiota conissans TaxID=109636 RepID=A0A9P5Z1L3_9AGAR|nr:hypothetical protein BDN70DRAFT_690029 [Pholiota conissans]
MDHRRAYEKFLLPEVCSFPLYNPSPIENLPLSCQREGVCIGDVCMLYQVGGIFISFHRISTPWTCHQPIGTSSTFSPTSRAFATRHRKAHESRRFEQALSSNKWTTIIIRFNF